MFRHIPRAVHCAPLELQTVVSREVYKHWAPPEPEHRNYSILRATQIIETPNGKFK